MSNRIAAFALVLAAGAAAALTGGCAPLVSETGPDTIVVQARDTGPATLAAAEEACAARDRRSFGPLRYQCVDAKNVAYCQQKAYVFACNVAPDDTGPAIAIAAAAAALPPSQ